MRTRWRIAAPSLWRRRCRFQPIWKRASGIARKCQRDDLGSGSKRFGWLFHRGSHGTERRPDLRIQFGGGADRGRCAGPTDAAARFRADGKMRDFLWGHPDLDDTIKRLQAFEQAGVDALMRRACASWTPYAPCATRSPSRSMSSWGCLEPRSASRAGGCRGEAHQRRVCAGTFGLRVPGTGGTRNDGRGHVRLCARRHRLCGTRRLLRHAGPDFSRRLRPSPCALRRPLQFEQACRIKIKRWKSAVRGWLNNGSRGMPRVRRITPSARCFSSRQMQGFIKHFQMKKLDFSTRRSLLEGR